MKVERIFNGLRACDSFGKLLQFSVEADCGWRARSDLLSLEFTILPFRKKVHLNLDLINSTFDDGTEYKTIKVGESELDTITVEFYSGWITVYTMRPLMVSGVDIFVAEKDTPRRLLRFNKQGKEIHGDELDDYGIKEGTEVGLIRDLNTGALIGVAGKDDLYYSCCEEFVPYSDELKIVANLPRISTEELYPVTCRKCKYYLSAVLLTKDENQYLDEWLKVNRAAGIEHFYILDNNDEDNAINYKDDDITVIPFRGKHRQLQYEAYEYWCRHYKTETTWVTFIDTDEMFTGNVVEYLKQREHLCMITPEWVCHNANGQIERDDISDSFKSFPVTVNNPYGLLGKPIVQTQYLQQPWVHNHLVDTNLQRLTIYEWRDRQYDEIQLHHFITRTLKEYVAKITRGSCDPVYLRKLREFIGYNPDMKEQFYEYLNSNNLNEDMIQ